MTAPLRSLILALTAVTVLSGCSSSPGKVSKDQLTQVRSSYDELGVGATKAEMMSTFKSANIVKLSSASILGKPVEEYKIEAYHDDDWNKSRDLFITFVYLVEDEVVDVSDERIDFRNNAEIVARWGGLRD